MLRNICLDHLSVGLSVCKVYCGKTADWIRMLFEVVSGVGRGISVLDGVVIVEGKGQFRGESGASRFNQWGLCDICQKLLNFTYAFKCYQQNCKLASL